MNTPGAPDDFVDGGAAVSPTDTVSPPRARRRPALKSVWFRFLVGFTLWLVTAVAVGATIFFNSERPTELFGHDVLVSPNAAGQAIVSTGPVLPDVRIDVPGPLGVDLLLGKTDATETEELIARYTLIVSNPEAQAEKVVDVVVSMGVSAALRGAAAGLVPVMLYLILGPVRRREMWEDVASLRPRPVFAVVTVAAIVAALWQPWAGEEGEISAAREWMPLDEFLGGDIPLPEEADAIEVRADLTSQGATGLIESMVDTWAKSQVFYDDAATAAGELELRTPEPGETVALLVTDRHDNVGMDRVARAVADRVGATAVFGGGDDTSTGARWEAFSLDSMSAAFEDLDRWAVTGNHDHGTFVGDYLADLGWTMLEGQVETGPGGGRLLGVPDPRSSGLGSWRKEAEITFADAQGLLADEVCRINDEEGRINTLLVHDPNLGRIALERGCTDLVIGGHHHVDKGPTRVEGENGEVGYSFTNGTTGGAAYAIAVGSKPKRDAQMSLITYGADGVPVGLQLVTLRTDGAYEVDEFVEFDLRSAQAA